MPAPLKEVWVAALEDKLQQKFTALYNCSVSGRALASKELPIHARHDIAPNEHALYFLVNCTAKDGLRIMASYHSSKLQYGKSSACFILPRRKAEWNSRVLRMQTLGSMIETAKLDIIDDEAIQKRTQITSSNQCIHNAAYLTAWKEDSRRWKFRYDPPSDNDYLLTSHWTASIAGLPSQILMDTGAQQNFVDAKSRRTTVRAHS